MTRSLLSLCAALALAALALAPTRGWANDMTLTTQPSRDVDLLLRGALVRGDPPAPRDLMLHLSLRADGTWDEHFMAWSGMRGPNGSHDDRDRRYNQMDHEGRITRVTSDGGRAAFAVDVTVHDDPWVKGGRARYALDLGRDGDTFIGTFTGTFNGQDVGGDVSGERRRDPWPAPVVGHRPVAPGEHPRLLFRKDDVPELRRRARTPEGRAMVERLKLTLGGGEAMPTAFNDSGKAYDREKLELPVGAYTLWHGMGFGMLYQLTGDAKYADLARQCVDRARAGQRDRDDRYAWDRPGGRLRAGSSYAAIAYAYDLCYDAWDTDYRRQIAREIQQKVIFPDDHAIAPKELALKEPVDVDLVFKTGGGQHSPISNHYGAWNGGGGTAILAILGDEGPDAALVARADRVFRRRAKRALEVGYGDSGYFFEGHYCGRLNSNTGLVDYLINLRVAAGEDYVTPFPGGRWLLTKWLYEIARGPDGTLHTLMRDGYARPTFERGGMSSGGDFSRGFGILPETDQPAALWFYNHVIEPERAKTYDTFAYPHHAIYALCFWPIAITERHPSAVLPKALRGDAEGYYVFRSGWRDGGDDHVATVRGDKGLIMAHGVRGEFAALDGGIQKVESHEDAGVHVLRTPRTTLIVDATGSAGAPLVVVRLSPAGDGDLPPATKPAAAAGAPRVDRRSLRVGGQRVDVTAVHAGELPDVAAESEGHVRLGRRVIRLTDGAVSTAATPRGDHSVKPAALSDVKLDPATMRGTAGYFRVGQSTSGKWFFVDPDGRPFVYRGVCGVNRAGTQGGRRAKPGRYAAAVDAKYDYQRSAERFSNETIARVRAWGFNALGAWATEEFFDRGLPYTEIVEFNKAGGPVVEAPGVKVPDVFDPAWRDAIDAAARSYCAPRRASRDLVGYFTDNELSWGQPGTDLIWGAPDAQNLKGPTLLQACLAQVDRPASRAAWEFVLARHGGDAAAVSRAWGVPVSSPQDVAALTGKGTVLHSTGYGGDHDAFSTHFAATYVRLADAAIRRYDPNHLILGARFGAPPGAPILAAFGPPHVDVVSANNYRRTMYERVDEYYRANPMPILIGEFAWASPPFVEQLSDAERRLPLHDHLAVAGPAALERAFTHPGVVGYTWYRWVQDPKPETGVGYGLVDTADEPNALNVRLLTSVNARLEAAAADR